MLTRYKKFTKYIFIVLITLLLLTGGMGVSPLPVQAEQVLAAPLPEGVRPPLSEQSASVLGETISAGYQHTCGLKSDGTLACWGYNGFGQVAPPDGTFTQVAAGAEHTCGLKTDGTLACWGVNNDGQSAPPAGTFTQVAAGGFHTCGLRTDGTHGGAPCQRVFGSGGRSSPAGASGRNDS